MNDQQRNPTFIKWAAARALRMLQQQAKLEAVWEKRFNKSANAKPQDTKGAAQ